VRPQVLETTALGAAYLAGLAVGYWKSDDEIAENWRVDRRFEPNMRAADARGLLDAWKDAIHATRQWRRT
jgi:glycerol kinase